ncbi:MAG: PQQ-binding-like beta-propeller repeat protein [Gemmataceae bacterium]
MMRVGQIAVALLASLVANTPLVADDTIKQPADVWGRFRGPNGAGVSSDKNIPTTFGPTEHVFWKTENPGVGNSSPIVWGKRIFLHSASRDGKQRSLTCIDAATGKQIWQKSLPAQPAKIRTDSSLASSTPTTDGSSVFVCFWDGNDVIVSAFDFDGTERWSKNLGGFNSQHGSSASPILYEDKLFLANDMDKDDFTTKVPNPKPSTLLAFDKRTGRILWEVPRTAERACYSAPFLRFGTAKEPELVVSSTTAVTGYNIQTGAILWEAKGWQETKVPMRTVASPAFSGDILCMCSGGDSGRFAVGLELPKPGSTNPPKRLWDNRKDLPYVPSPVALGDHFYFVTDAGFAGCVHAKTGKREWLERISSPGGFYASPLIIDGKIYAANSAGDVFVIQADSTACRLLARNELGETIRATPAVADGHPLHSRRTPSLVHRQVIT